MRTCSGSEGFVVVGDWTGAEDGGLKGASRPKRRKTAWAAVSAHREIVAACSRGMLSETS